MTTQATNSTRLCHIHKQAPVLQHRGVMRFANQLSQTCVNRPATCGDRLVFQIGFQVVRQRLGTAVRNRMASAGSAGDQFQVAIGSGIDHPRRYDVLLQHHQHRVDGDAP